MPTPCVRNPDPTNEISVTPRKALPPKRALTSKVAPYLTYHHEDSILGLSLAAIYLGAKISTLYSVGYLDALLCCCTSFALLPALKKYGQVAAFTVPVALYPTAGLEPATSTSPEGSRMAVEWYRRGMAVEGRVVKRAPEGAEAL